MKTIFNLTVSAVLFAVVATSCGGSSSPAPDVTGQNKTGEQNLAESNVSAAKATYCEAAQSNPSDSTAAFGCAMTKMIAIGESDPIVSMVKGIGEEPINMQEAFFDDGKFFDVMFKEYYETVHPYPNETVGNVDLDDFPWLPVANYFKTENLGHNWGNYLETIFQNMIGNEYTLPKVQQDLVSFADSLKEIHDLLLIAKNDPNFSFLIPAHFFRTREDVQIYPVDIYFFDSAIQAARFSLALQNKYEPVVDLSVISHDSDKLDVEALVDCLNGEKCATQFGRLKEGVGNLLDLKPFVQDSLADGRTALEMLQSGAESNLLRNINRLMRHLEKRLAVVKDLQESLSGPKVISYTKDKLTVNLKQFFETPPDSKNIEIDPFDYKPRECKCASWNSDKTYCYFEWCAQEGIHFVESFFKEFAKGIVEYNK